MNPITNNTIAELHIPCPKCSSSDAYCVYGDGHGYCFSCEYYSPPEGKENSSVEYTREYLPWRGVEASTFRTYGALTRVDNTGKPISLEFWYPEGACKIRLLHRKEFFSTGDIAKAGLFGRNKFAAGSHKHVTITEGELDACSLYQVLRSPVVSVQSSSTAKRDCILDLDWLRSFERIYLAFDSDEAGREALSRCAKLFDYNKVFVVKYSNRKDANEYLQAGETAELRNLWWNSKKYLPETIVSSFKEFSDILREPAQKGVSYPWCTISEMTYGIRTSESVLITAQEGVGKTELMHAIEHHFLKETDYAIGAIYLEEPKKRHLQAIAGLELSKPVHLPDSGVTDDQVISALEKVVRVDDRLHLYSHFGSDDPESLLDTIRFLVAARSCRVILLDHITMAVSGLAGEDERRALDYLSTRLEMMVKELDFALIIVSHVNDVGQTRGSRYISKIADIRIDAARDVNSGENVVYLSISKNRFSGRTGPAGKLIFDPDTFTLREELNYESSQSPRPDDNSRTPALVF
jgi:twinkle protein